MTSFITNRSLMKARNKEKPSKVEFFVKRNSIFFLLIALTAAIILRLDASTLPVTDKWAEQQLEANYGAAGKQSLIGTPRFEAEAEKLSEQYKSIYKDKDGNTYLYGVDSYNFLRQAKGVLGGREADSLLPYLEVYFYKFLKFFNSKTTLMEAAFWLPFAVTMLSIILIFFIARKLTNDLGGFFAAFLLAIHPQFFTATQPGFTDTNFLNLFFTLLIVFLFFEGIDFSLKSTKIKEFTKNNIRQIIHLILVIPAVFLFKFAWDGWFYIIFIILVFASLYISYLLIYKIKEGKSKRYAIALALLLIIVIGSFYLLKDTDFVKAKTDRVKARLGMHQENTLFPSTAPMTTELLSAPEAQKIKKSSQGPLLYILNGWILAVLTITSLLLLIKKHCVPGGKAKYALFVFLWFILMFFAGYNSIRFLSFFALPFAIVASYGFVFLSDSSTALLAKRYKKSIVKPAIVIILLLIIVIPLKDTLSERAERTPMMTSLIEKTAEEIKKSGNDTIINMWWDKGYFYKYYAERKVLMDNGVGGTSDPRIYWMARVFMDNDEENAINIFRMMDYINPDELRILSQDIDLSAINHTPQQSLILLDSGLIGKIDTFDYYTQWDFNGQNKPYAEPNIPSISSPSSCLPSNDKSKMVCGENFIIDLKNSRLIYKGAEFPLVIVLEDKVYYSNKTGQYSLLVYPEKYEQGLLYKAVLIRSDILDSMFVRLYFMKGIGLKHFELFSDIADPIAGRVVVYKIKWDI